MTPIMYFAGSFVIAVVVIAILYQAGLFDNDMFL